jgi:RNA polymerase sigma factor (TIGR02999 family)
MSDITQLLAAAERGDAKASEEILPIVYEELRRLAAAKLSRELPGQTLQATALVHEAWLRLTGSGTQHWNGSAHFFAAAAEAMRRILIERARGRKRVRHGGGLQRIDLDKIDVAMGEDDEVLLRINEAVEKLTTESPEHADLVKLRYFAGLSIAEVARSHDISEATAKRRWAYARAWLYAELKRAN